MTNRINFRHRAKDHFRVVTKLMERPNEDALLLVALRLRMSIECLAYELLQSFEDEVLTDLMEKWQPGALIRELKEIDSSIDSDRSISIGVKVVQGEPLREMRSLGTDVRLSASWVQKNWQTLGNYLHEPTIKQHKDGKVIDVNKMKGKVTEIYNEVERVLNSSLFAANVNVHVTMNCNCGFPIKRREELLKRDRYAVCAGCETIWNARQIDGEWRFRERDCKFSCPNCREENNFSAKELREGSEFTCEKCGTVLSLVRDWCIRLKSSSENGAQN